MIIRIIERVGTVNTQPRVVRVVRVYNFRVPSGISESAFTQKGGLLVGTGAGTYLEKSPGATGKYLKYDPTSPTGIGEDTPSLNVDDNANHLLNGGFAFAQRQTPGTLTTIADNTYSADQWKATRENAGLQYIRQDGSGESGLVSPYYGQFKKITNAGKFLVFQPLEYLDTLKFRGRTVNFQIQMKASGAKTIKMAVLELQAAGTKDTLPTPVSAWGTDGTDPTLGTNLAVIATPVSCSVTTAWQVFQFTGTFPTTSKNLLVAIWTDADFAADDTLSLAEAGLYFGATQRSWIANRYSDELRRVQRYYSKSFNIDTAPAQNLGINNGDLIFTAVGGTTERFMFFLPQVMRSTPTMTFYNPLNTNDKIRDVTGSLDCTNTDANTTNTNVNVYGLKNAGTVAGNRLSVHWTAEAGL